MDLCDNTWAWFRDWDKDDFKCKDNLPSKQCTPEYCCKSNQILIQRFYFYDQFAVNSSSNMDYILVLEILRIYNTFASIYVIKMFL